MRIISVDVRPPKSGTREVRRPSMLFDVAPATWRLTSPKPECRQGVRAGPAAPGCFASAVSFLRRWENLPDWGLLGGDSGAAFRALGDRRRRRAEEQRGGRPARAGNRRAVKSAGPGSGGSCPVLREPPDCCHPAERWSCIRPVGPRPGYAPELDPAPPPTRTESPPSSPPSPTAAYH